MTPLETPPEVKAYRSESCNDLGEDPVFEQGRSYLRDFADAALAARTQQAEELAAELERAQSWDGIIDHLNRVYPAETFSDYSGDGGPTIVALTRVLYTIGQTLDRTIARAGQAEARCRELEAAAKMVHRWFPDRVFCDACHAEIEEYETGAWYWHWHRVRDGRGGWYCHECGPVYGTTDQDEVPDPCDCPDCVAISTRREQNTGAYLAAIETSSKRCKPQRDALRVTELEAENAELRTEVMVKLEARNRAGDHGEPSA